MDGFPIRPSYVHIYNIYIACFRNRVVVVGVGLKNRERRGLGKFGWWGFGEDGKVYRAAED